MAPGGLQGARESLGVTRLPSSVAEAASETALEGGSLALAVFVPVLVVSLLLGGAYVYVTR